MRDKLTSSTKVFRGPFVASWQRQNDILHECFFFPIFAQHLTMGLTKEEAEIQCDWASTLGLSPTGPEDGAAVIQACGVGHRRNRKKTNGDTTQVSLQQDTTPVTGELD